MPSIDDAERFLTPTKVTDRERGEGKEVEDCVSNDKDSRDVGGVGGEVGGPAVFGTPVRKQSVGLVFSNGEGGCEVEGDDDDSVFRDDDGDDDDDDDDGAEKSKFNGHYESDDDDSFGDAGYEGYNRDAGNGFGDNGGHGWEEMHGSSKRSNLGCQNADGGFSTPSTIVMPLPDPDEPLPSIEPHSSPAFPLSSPRSRSGSKSAGNTPSSNRFYSRHRSNIADDDDGGDDDRLCYDYDRYDADGRASHHVQHSQSDKRHRRRRRQTSLSTDLSVTSTISSLPSSVMGGRGPFIRPNDPTAAFAPMARRPRPVVNRNELLRMVPRSVPAKMNGGYGPTQDKHDRIHGRAGSFCTVSTENYDIDSPSRGRSRGDRRRMMTTGAEEGSRYKTAVGEAAAPSLGITRSYHSQLRQPSMSSMLSDDGYGIDDACANEMGGMNTQSALTLPPSPSPSSSTSSPSRQLHLLPSHHISGHRHSRTQTPLQNPMMLPRPFSTPQPQLPPQPPPLVLLHATILPPALPLPYSSSALAALAPPFIHRNARLLAEKLDAQVLARGVLVSHPHEDYELLEERILESLELVVPRVSVCGHFLGGGSTCEMNDLIDEDDEIHEEEEEEDIGNGRIIDEYIHDHEHKSHEEEQHSFEGRFTSSFTSKSTPGAAAARPHCTTCAHPLRIPFSPEDLKPNSQTQLISRSGSGSFDETNDNINNSSSLRWDVRIYAANGLMRAGAWTTAWREMERVDVQIGVWIPEGLKMRLEEWDREHGFVTSGGDCGYDGLGGGGDTYDLEAVDEVGNERGSSIERCEPAKDAGESIASSSYDGGNFNSTADNSREPEKNTMLAAKSLITIIPNGQLDTLSQTAGSEYTREQSQIAVTQAHKQNNGVADSLFDNPSNASSNQPLTPNSMPSSLPPLPAGFTGKPTAQDISGDSSTSSTTSSSRPAASASYSMEKRKQDIPTSPSPQKRDQDQIQYQEQRSSFFPISETPSSLSVEETSKPGSSDSTDKIKSNPSSSQEPSSSKSTTHSSTSQLNSPLSHTSSPSTNPDRLPATASTPPSSSSSSSPKTHKTLTHHMRQPQNIIIAILSILVAILALRGPATRTAQVLPAPAGGTMDSLVAAATAAGDETANANQEPLIHAPGIENDRNDITDLHSANAAAQDPTDHTINDAIGPAYGMNEPIEDEKQVKKNLPEDTTEHQPQPDANIAIAKTESDAAENLEEIEEVEEGHRDQDEGVQIDAKALLVEDDGGEDLVDAMDS